MATSLNQQQQTFALSMLSNTPMMADINDGSAKAKLQSLIDANVTANAADNANWQIVYGPVGTADATNPSIPDNAMYVAKNMTTGTDYVLAVAGTRPGANFAVDDEDGKSELSQYDITKTEQVNISIGTQEGLNILLAMQDNQNVSLIGTDSGDGFLPGISGSAANVLVTGHSLGGALAPALALVLFNTRSAMLADGSQGNWDSAGNVTLSFLETAGPAVGDSAYVSKLAQAMPTSQGIWNCIDIVPHAWWNLYSSNGLCNSTTANPVPNIEKIYTPYTSDPNYVPSRDVARVIELAYLKQTDEHTPINQTPSFTGTFSDIELPSGCASDFDTNIYYCAEIIHQHINAYLEYFNCEFLVGILTNNNPNGTLPVACGLLKKFVPTTDCSCIDS